VSANKSVNDQGRRESAEDEPSELTRAITAGLSLAGAAETAAPFLPALTEPERGVQAVLLYGSTLWSALRGAGSHPDFIAVVDDLRGWARGLPDRLWGAVLPPTVYHLRADGAEAKVSVVTARQLALSTESSTRDLHLAGRLSKRVALVWSRDEAARRQVILAQRAALEVMGRLALARFEDRVGLDEFLETLLGLSYESEIRIAEPGKIRGLYEVEREHYRAVGRALLAGLGATAIEGEPDAFRLPAGVSAPAPELRRRLRQSRRRAALRCPKYLATYDGWLEYLVQKLARSGNPVSLTERQRRHPLIFALPVLFKLIRTRRVG
jgi:hypothetical protein